MTLSLIAVLFSTIFCVTVSHKITVDCGPCQKKTCFSGNCIIFKSQYGYIKQEICTDTIWTCEQDQFPVTIYSKECEHTRFRPDLLDDQFEQDGNIYECPTKCCVDDHPQFLNQVCVVDPQFHGHRLCEQQSRNQFWIILVCLICLVSTFVFIWYKEKQKKQANDRLNNEPERQMNQSINNSKSSSYQSNALVSSKQSMEEGGMMKMYQMGMDHAQPQKKGPMISQTK